MFSVAAQLGFLSSCRAGGFCDRWRTQRPVQARAGGSVSALTCRVACFEADAATVDEPATSSEVALDARVIMRAAYLLPVRRFRLRLRVPRKLVEGVVGH